jgi:hypothetical protein
MKRLLVHLRNERKKPPQITQNPIAQNPIYDAGTL